MDRDRPSPPVYAPCAAPSPRTAALRSGACLLARRPSPGRSRLTDGRCGPLRRCPPSAGPGSSPPSSPRPRSPIGSRVVYRTRAGPAAAPAGRADAGRPRPAVRGRRSSTPRPGTCPPGSSRRATGARVRASSSSTAGSRTATGPCRTPRSSTRPASTSSRSTSAGHGDNPPETLPISVAEFRDDALAALDALLARPEVTAGGVPRPLAGRGRGDPRRGGGRRSLRGARQHVRPGRSATARPARRSASPGCRSPSRSRRRWPSSRPGSTCVRAATRWATSRPAGRSRATPGRCCSSTARSTRSCPPAHEARLEAAARRGAARRVAGRQAGGRADRDGAHPRGSALAGCTSTRTTGGSSPASSREALDGPLEPRYAADRAAAVDAVRVPEPDESFAAVAMRPGRRRTIAELMGSEPRRRRWWQDE